MIDFEGLLDSLGGLVLVCDEDGLVVWVNDGAREFLGDDFDELCEHPLDTWLRGPDGFLWPAIGEESGDRVLMYEANGRSERMRGDIRSCPVQGQMGSVAHLRLAAGQAERLEGLQALSGTIAAQLALSLKTIITSATESLMQRPGDHAESFRRVLDAAQGAALLQKQLAGLGGEADLRRTPMSLGSLVHDNERTLQSALGRKYALVIEGCEAGEGVIVGDPHALGIVLVELAEWVATYHGGTSGGLRMSLDASGDDSVRLQLTDDGQGLTATQRAALHDPSGPGLGLAIAFGVVNQHGGRILVDSVLGRGTTFHLEFPAEGSREAETPAPRRGTETILVVEDEEVIRRWVQVTLEALGYNVLTARNGVDAAAILREKRDECDLLIIDAVLPGISGLELIAETRAADPNKRVLLMTGYSADLVGSEVLDQVPLLEKPFTPAELVDFVNQLLDD